MTRRMPEVAPEDHGFTIGDICRTNVSQPGGLVKILEIGLSWTGKPVAHIEHIEDHPYGYEEGDRGCTIALMRGGRWRGHMSYWNDDHKNPNNVLRFLDTALTMLREMATPVPTSANGNRQPVPS